MKYWRGIKNTTSYEMKDRLNDFRGDKIFERVSVNRRTLEGLQKTGDILMDFEILKIL